MRSLLLDVSRLPPPGGHAASQLSAFPQVLEEGMQLWRREACESRDALWHKVEAYQPAVIAFLGSEALSTAWCRLSAELFPQIFALAHPAAGDQAVIDAINQSIWRLRRARLSGGKGRRPQPDLAGGPEVLFAGDIALRQRVRGWIERYRLQPLIPRMEPGAFERGLYCLALLEQHLDPLRPGPVLDVGCHLWSYAPFLRAFLADKSELRGVEIDPWYLQADGLTRADWACYYAGLAKASWLEGDPRTLSLPAQELITLLMPIILPENALRWGIPLARHDPDGLLRSLRALLRPGGQLLIYNGVEREYEATLDLLSRIGWGHWTSGPHHCPLRGKSAGYVTRLRQPGA